MPTTTSPDGSEIAYRVLGDGPLDVVFVHGWASSSTYWDLLLEHLPVDKRRFVLLDLRGHGQSPGTGQEHTVPRYAEDILAVADAAGLDRFVTVGHSMGGKFCQYLRVLARERLLGQIGITPSPACFIPEEADEKMIAFMSSMAGDVDKIYAMFEKVSKEPLPEPILRPLAEECSHLSHHVLSSSFRGFASFDFEAELAKGASAPPTLVIGGSADPFYTVELLAGRIPVENPNATLSLLDCGHTPMHELPRETALLVEGFLAAIDPAARPVATSAAGG
jgi:non-heme chloroperoxidase